MIDILKCVGIIILVFITIITCGIPLFIWLIVYIIKEAIYYYRYHRYDY